VRLVLDGFGSEAGVGASVSAKVGMGGSGTVSVSASSSANGLATEEKNNRWMLGGYIESNLECKFGGRI
jgi:hypothetical protein